MTDVRTMWIGFREDEQGCAPGDILHVKSMPLQDTISIRMVIFPSSVRAAWELVDVVIGEKAQLDGRKRRVFHDEAHGEALTHRIEPKLDAASPGMWIELVVRRKRAPYARFLASACGDVDRSVREVDHA